MEKMKKMEVTPQDILKVISTEEKLKFSTLCAANQTDPLELLKEVAITFNQSINLIIDVINATAIPIYNMYEKLEEIEKGDRQ